MPDIEMCLSTSCPSSRQCIRHKASGSNPSPMQAYGYHEPDWYGRCPFYLSKPETLGKGDVESSILSRSTIKTLRNQPFLPACLD